jgi:hypothetical protein
MSFIIKRHKGMGLLGGSRYSFEPRTTANPFTGKDEPEKLWAQERRGDHKMFVISSNESDLTKPRSERSAGFLGKLDVVESNRVYVGYKQTPTSKADKEPVVSVVYDHDRASTIDRKMDIALPLISFSKDNIAMVSQRETSQKPPDALLRLFMQVRREGQENFLEADKLLVLTQFDDAPEAMSADSILSGQMKDIATAVSTKNFSLVPKVSTRNWDTSAHHSPPRPQRGDEEKPGFGSPTAGPSIFVCDQAESRGADDSRKDLSEANFSSFMQFGKRNQDVYYCKVTCSQISPLVAFMIILTRFDTLQKF